MNETIDLDAMELPRMRVIVAGKEHAVLPASLLARLDELRQGREEVPFAEAVEAVRQASGIPELTPDQAFRLPELAEEFLARCSLAKKKRLSTLLSRGSTASRSSRSGKRKNSGSP